MTEKFDFTEHPSPFGLNIATLVFELVLFIIIILRIVLVADLAFINFFGVCLIVLSILMAIQVGVVYDNRDYKKEIRDIDENSRKERLNKSLDYLIKVIPPLVGVMFVLSGGYMAFCILCSTSKPGQGPDKFEIENIKLLGILCVLILIGFVSVSGLFAYIYESMREYNDDLDDLDDLDD